MATHEDALHTATVGENFFVSVEDALGKTTVAASKTSSYTNVGVNSASTALSHSGASASHALNDAEEVPTFPSLQLQQAIQNHGLSEFLVRARAALAFRVETPPQRSDAAIDVSSIANKEQIKLVQSVFLSPVAPARVVVFSGVEAGNGCSRICAETAVALASHIPGTVCVIDADLQFPTLHYFFGLKNERGFGEAMVETAPVMEYTHRLGSTNLWVMTAGGISPERQKLLTVKVLRQRIKQLSEVFNYVLIDGSPLTTSAHATKLGISTDGLLMVMGANSTRRETAQRAKEDLRAVNCKILGVVLNRRTFPIPSRLYRWL